MKLTPYLLGSGRAAQAIEKSLACLRITDPAHARDLEGVVRLPRNIVHLVSLCPWESYDVGHTLDSRLEVRMYDSVDDVPDLDQVVQIAKWVNACREQGPTLVHCQAGLNRSGLVAATALVLDGFTAAEAVATLRASRSPAVLCNPAFLEMLESM